MNEHSLLNIAGSIIEVKEIESLINRAITLPSYAYSFWYRVSLCDKAIELAEKHGLKDKVFEIKETILNLCEDTNNHTNLLSPYPQPRDKTANLVYLYSYAVNTANSIGKKERAKMFLERQIEERKTLGV